jgi:protein-disulfide isomerase
MDMIKNLSPKSSFFVGVIVTLFIFFVIGFFVLLGILIKGKNQNEVSVLPNQVLEDGSVAGDSKIEFSPITNADWILGSQNPKVTFLVYSDIECPYCQMYHETLTRVVENYGNDVRLVWRHFPLTSLHPNAVKVAEATECAGDLGGNEVFWSFVDKLMDLAGSSSGIELARLPDVAESMGLNKNSFVSCLDSGRYESKVIEHVNDAYSAGAEGTPYSIIMTQDGEFIPVSGAVQFEQIQGFLEEVL